LDTFDTFMRFLKSTKLFANINPSNLGGNAVTLPPAPVAAVAPAGFGPEMQLLRVAGCATDPSMMTVTCMATVNNETPGGAGGNELTAGPVVGIIKWGSGDANQFRAEFDIPIQNVNGVLARFGGSIISVPGHYCEILARNDANLIPFAGDAALGGTGADGQAGRGPALAFANVARYARGGPSSPLLTVYGRNAADGGGLAPLGTVQMRVPNFAQAVRVLRFDAQAINVTLLHTAGGALDGPFAIAANQPSPIFDLSTNVGFIQVTNTGAAAISRIISLFEIGL